MAGEDLKKPDVTKKEANKTRKLHQYIRSGDIPRAKSLTRNLSMEERRNLTRPIPELGLKPAIFIAIEKRKKKFVKFLVNECHADINEEASCILEDDFETPEDEPVARDVSPLELAIFYDMSPIAKFLMSAGADVSKLVQGKSIMLKACSAGSYEVVKVLVDHGANVNVSDRSGDSCLMQAVYKQSNALVRLLVDKGADVKYKNNDGNTALHISVRLHDCIDSVKLLLDKGADPFSRNKDGYDVLRTAALSGSTKIVDFLLKTIFKDDNVKRKIESYQILGVKLQHINGSAEAISLWKRAIQLTSNNQMETVAVTLETPFGVAVEATSISELEDMRNNPDAICMQSIVLCHKHLSSTSRLFRQVILYSATEYGSNGSYGKCFRLLAYFIKTIPYSTLHLLERCERLRVVLCFTECNVRQLGNLGVRPSIGFDTVYEFLETMRQVMSKCIDYEETLLCMKVLLNVIFLFSLVECKKSEKLDLKKLLRFVVKTDPKTRDGKTILLAAVQLGRGSNDTVLTSPSYLNVISTLLECGSDINETDANGNNAAHLLVDAFLEDGKRNESRFRNIGVKLIEYGVHLDARNHRGMEASTCLQELGIRVAPPINLMCSSARAIRRFNFSLQSLERLLPKFLFDFVEKH